MKFKILILLCLSMLNNCNLFAQEEWILAGYSSSSEPYYVNSTLLERDGENITIWIKSITEKKTISKKTKKTIYSNSENKILYEFNCSGSKLKLKYAINYNSKGEVISNYKPEEFEQEWEYVVPGSIGEILLNKACELYNN